MSGFLAGFAKDESGVTAMEYGMITALIAIAVIVVLGRLGSDLNVTFDSISSELEQANGTK